jgi:hypothetical protein
MARTTEEEVRDLVGAAADVAVLHHITDASLIVDEVLADCGMTPGRLALIEKYLAAHFHVMATENGGIIREKVGESEVSYVGANSRAGSSEGLKASRFGQQAIALDTCGKLLAMSSPKKTAQLRVV